MLRLFAMRWNLLDNSHLDPDYDSISVGHMVMFVVVHVGLMLFPFLWDPSEFGLKRAPNSFLSVEWGIWLATLLSFLQFSLGRVALRLFAFFFDRGD